MIQSTMSMIHDPSARLDYVWDWSAWLDEGETITSHAVTVLPPDEMEIETTAATGQTVTAWISGGTLGRSYTLTCHITTSATREDDRSFILSVRNR